LESQNGGYRETRQSSVEEQKTLLEKDSTVTSIVIRSEVQVWSKIKSIAGASAYRIKGKPLVLQQVNCSTVYNEALKFCNFVDTYISDVVIGMESWLKEDINNAEAFRFDVTTFRIDSSARGFYLG
jgi:hypothetical protein